MISDMISELKKRDLTYDEMSSIMADILSGSTDDKQNVEFLSHLTEKGESEDELLGMLDQMRKFSLKVEIENKGTVIDMCGTGGDKLQTFNISTTASFVVAAAGGIVAKHGNRSNSGVSGSADIFEYFKYNLEQEPAQIAEILKQYNICFMFAQKFHPAMRHVSTARKQLGRRTAFNLLGPLSNPAGVKNQLIGVSSLDYLEGLPLILKRSGAENIMTVRAENGMDEFSTSCANRVCILRDGKVLTNIIDPEIIGLHKSKIEDIQINTKQESIESFVKVLNGTANQAMIETVALNAAGGLIVAGVVKNFEDGIVLALETIKDGRAISLLEKFVKGTGDISKLEEITNG